MHSKLLRYVAFDLTLMFLRASLQSDKFMVQFVSTVTPLNYFTIVGDFSRWLSLPC